MVKPNGTNRRNKLLTAFPTQISAPRHAHGSCRPQQPANGAETCRYIEGSWPQTILKLGAGTGAITLVALEQMHPESTLLALEMDADFVPILQQRCPGAQILQTDAGNIQSALLARGIERVDVILSGLPIPVLPRPVNQAIFASKRWRQTAP